MDEEDVRPLPGKVDMVQVAPAVFDEYAARLLVPDPEQRHYWREYWIRRVPQPKPGSRGMGF
jgi:hypothetical protein